jgi:hypothetical protein
MKKSLTKLIVSGAAVMTVAAAMAVSASAATTYDIADGAETGTITNGLTPAVASGAQATILVQDKAKSATEEGAILFIDQQAYDGTTNPWATITVKALADGTYTVKVGGEGVTAASEDFTVGTTASGETVLLGDVVGNDGAVTNTDATVILRYTVKNAAALAIINTPKQEFIADINSDKSINNTDATIALRASVNQAAALTYIKEVEYVAE